MLAIRKETPMPYYLTATDKRNMEKLLRERAAEEERTFRRKNVSILKPPAQLMAAFSHMVAIIQGMGFQHLPLEIAAGALLALLVAGLLAARRRRA